MGSARTCGTGDGRLAQRMIERAATAKAPFTWVTPDEAYDDDSPGYAVPAFFARSSSLASDAVMASRHPSPSLTASRKSAGERVQSNVSVTRVAPGPSGENS
jgi:hypothetical protein